MFYVILIGVCFILWEIIYLRFIRKKSNGKVPFDLKDLDKFIPINPNPLPCKKYKVTPNDTEKPRFIVYFKCDNTVSVSTLITEEIEIYTTEIVHSFEVNLDEIVEC